MGTLKHRTASEAKLTLEKYRTISLSMRGLCLWLGPVTLAIGILQAVYVPAMFQVNPWGFIIGGAATVGCAFQWPRLKATR